MIALQIGHAQAARKAKVQGPRATGLVELAPNGKAHLIPITIMVDGKFYDASAYKADPVPFALESAVVYEAMRTGVPQGEFTVTGALQAQDAWFGEGKWVPEGTKPKKKKVTDNKPSLDEDSGPPTLRKAGGAKSSGGSGSNAPASTAPSGSSSAPTPKTGDSTSSTPSASPSGSSTASSNPSAKPSNNGDQNSDKSDQAAQASSEDSSESANDEDPSRPSLRRGKAPPSSKAAPESTGSTSQPSGSSQPSAHSTTSTSGSSTKSKTTTATSSASIQLLPAVSDAGGPEPRPYAFEMKPDEEQSYRKKLLALVAPEVVAKAKEMTPVLPSAAPPKRTTGAKPIAKPTQPIFENIQFRAFDLWNTNEPVFVMSAQAHIPVNPAAKPAPTDTTYFVTLVAKADIYLDLHKLLVQVTDNNHLDEFAKLELIDAVDADGDGRGELLFREISDAGTAFAVYRAAADRLYPLFEGKPQSSHPLPASVQ